MVMPEDVMNLYDDRINGPDSITEKMYDLVIILYANINYTK